MNPIFLWLDPRGAIGRGAFLAGVAGLGAVLLAATAAVAASPLSPVAMALLPVLGPGLLVGWCADAFGQGRVPLEQAGMALLLALRLYPLACLSLKRLADAGRGPGPLVVVGMTSLMIDGAMLAWTCDLWAQEMAVILPFFAGIVLKGLLWGAFLVWLGTAPQPRLSGAAA